MKIAVQVSDLVLGDPGPEALTVSILSLTTLHIDCISGVNLNNNNKYKKLIPGLATNGDSQRY